MISPDFSTYSVMFYASPQLDEGLAPVVCVQFVVRSSPKDLLGMCLPETESLGRTLTQSAKENDVDGDHTEVMFKL